MQNQTLSFSVEHCRETWDTVKHGLHQIGLTLSHFTTLCLLLAKAISLRLMKVYWFSPFSITQWQECRVYQPRKDIFSWMKMRLRTKRPFNERFRVMCIWSRYLGLVFWFKANESSGSFQSWFEFSDCGYFGLLILRVTFTWKLPWIKKFLRPCKTMAFLNTLKHYIFSRKWWRKIVSFYTCFKSGCFGMPGSTLYYIWNLYNFRQ